MSATYEQAPWAQPLSHPGTNLPPLEIYNSLTRSKNTFIPKDPEGRRVAWYSCGPTVYDDAHLGHARNYVTTDIIRRIMQDYFNFEVQFVMNITDVDDKVLLPLTSCLFGPQNSSANFQIIVRARQQHLFADYVAKHHVVDDNVIKTARLAFAAFLKAKLPLVDSEVHPSDFQQEAQKTYAFVINGGALEGNKKPGSDEAKVKMNIKSGSLSGKVVGEALKRMENSVGVSQPGEQHDAASTEGSQPSSEDFYSICEDVFLVYLDKVSRSSIPDDDYSIFSKLTKYYEDRFMEDMRNLNVLDPDKLTRVTEYGPEIVKFVEQIVQRKFGYPTPDGSVYFDIKSFEQAGNYYARLEPWSRNDRSLQKEGEGALSQHVIAKHSKNDFALWKASQPGEPSWPSPWGKGRPGWHIECSAMASAELGSQMDIHSGGIDLSFPHHDNELAQSEAYWQGGQWVNYFMHMGHLSIQGAKMSKSLKNFTTVRKALEGGAWSPRNLRIVFLLGGWREGIEITEDMVRASNSWEEKLNNFFMKAKNLLASNELSTSQEHGQGVGNSLATSLKSAQAKVFNALCDSFDTPTAMSAISELVSNFNSAEVSDLDISSVESSAKWVTSMVNCFGLNGTASRDSPNIGWEGIDVPEYAKPYLNSLSTTRDALRQLAKSKTPISNKVVSDILRADTDLENVIPDAARPYADVLASFRSNVAAVNLDNPQGIAEEVLALCDRVRDTDLFNLGIYLEDRESRPALVRPVTRDLVEARQQQAEQRLEKQRAKEEQRQKELEKLEKGKCSPFEMFRTNEFSAWDADGLPTKDSSGNDIAKSRSKKLRKDLERQKKLHEMWLASNPIHL
ncbi:cysteine-tRNA ligase [[Emmonsia] crescens]|uniref:cysteine--tRNA ligase n=1 Tax=[Emmonsia] crescens TaxID=73230 RepID=A0A2B7ZN05_9EURO|nr:cysteine-tRNA ligase [Emmonsia crescens]